MWRVTSRTALVLAAGTVAGLAVGLVVARFLATLFFDVRATDARQLTLSSCAATDLIR